MLGSAVRVEAGPAVGLRAALRTIMGMLGHDRGVGGS